MRPNCWLIGDYSGKFPAIAAQFARLRGMNVQFRSITEGGGLSELPWGRGNLVAIDFEVLSGLNAAQKQQLKRLVEHGHTLYVRSGFEPGGRYSLEPFSDEILEVGAAQRASSYRFSDLQTIPAVLRGEECVGDFAIAAAEVNPGKASPLLLVNHRDGLQRASIFVIKRGAGVVIFDLNNDQAMPDDLVICRLAHPSDRFSTVGAMIAADTACGLNPDRALSFNLTLDDRPANFDYFCAGKLRRFLEHLQTRFPGVHIDFAWTPDQSRPTRSYIQTLKDFNTGFVWHGFLRHIDHRTISNPARDFEEGRRLVDEISERYDVRFQPVMVFPYEKDNSECEEVLKYGDFVAKSETPAPSNPDREQCAAHVRFVNSSPVQDSVTLLARQSVPVLDEPHMLAIAALGRPVIAHAHPKDVALRRFVSRPGDIGSVSYFDDVLNFAASKAMHPKSLEEIAAEVSE